jgi:hypothetical protein
VLSDTSSSEDEINLLAMSASVLLDASPRARKTSKDFYVATTGSDLNPGTQAAPVRKIARADPLAGAGYAIHVAVGTYKVSAPSPGNAGVLTKKSGTATAPINFVSDVKWGAKITVSGTRITWESLGNDVDIDGFNKYGAGRHGILAGRSNLTITNSSIHDLAINGHCDGSGGAAINTYRSTGNILIDRNVTKNIGY